MRANASMGKALAFYVSVRCIILGVFHNTVFGRVEQKASQRV